MKKIIIITLITLMAFISCTMEPSIDGALAADDSGTTVNNWQDNWDTTDEFLNEISGTFTATDSNGNSYYFDVTLTTSGILSINNIIIKHDDVTGTKVTTIIYKGYDPSDVDSDGNLLDVDSDGNPLDPNGDNDVNIMNSDPLIVNENVIKLTTTVFQYYDTASGWSFNSDTITWTKTENSLTIKVDDYLFTIQ